MSIANMSMRAKYAEAIVMFLRLKEKEVGPTAIHLKVIAENVINMVGLTIEEKAKVTANRENPSAEWSIYYTFQFLKYVGILKNTQRGYWGLTKNGRKSRLYHQDYIQAYRCYVNQLKHCA